MPRLSHSGENTTPFLDLRGSIDVSAHGVTPGGESSQYKRLAEIIASAARENRPVFLPPGDYPVSDLDLPDGARLTGVAGASRLVRSGGAQLIRSSATRRVEISNLVLEGGRGDSGDAIVDLAGVGEVILDNCLIRGGRGTAVRLERCGGRIERSHIFGAGEYGLFAVDSSGLSVLGNTVSDCGNGGILIHRRTKGSDGTMVRGNRVLRAGAASGGTGQFGNGINLFRADGVIVAGNQIVDCAFSAIRANSASNAQITDNQCLGSGETAIYAEFAFEGAIISGNLVDGGANGISVVNFNEGGRLATVANNLVRNLKPTGPYMLEEAIFGVGISAEADTVVSGNVVENVPLWGLALGFGPYLRDVLATGNIVRQARIGCAVSVAEGAGSAVISNNLFASTRDGGVIGHLWRAPATGELGRGDGDAFRHLTIQNNRIG